MTPSSPGKPSSISVNSQHALPLARKDDFWWNKGFSEEVEKLYFKITTAPTLRQQQLYDPYYWYNTTTAANIEEIKVGAVEAAAIPAGQIETYRIAAIDWANMPEPAIQVEPVERTIRQRLRDGLRNR